MNSINKKTYNLFALFSLLLFSCGENDPVIPNEEELITSIVYTLVPDGGGSTVVFSFRDIDGDGGNIPIVITGTLEPSTNYSATLLISNESVSPAINISEEILEEAEDHQFFLIAENNLNATINYQDEDANGNPLGLSTSFITGPASSGKLTITLRHEPKKPNNGTLADAGGETDIQVTFDVVIE